MLNCGSGRQLCRVLSDSVVPRTAPSAPNGLILQHTLGSGMFRLLSTVNSSAPLLVTCRTPGLTFNPATGGAPVRRSNRATMPTKTRPLFSSAPSVPVRFRCLVHRCGAGLPSHLDVHCRCALGQLVIEGVAFLEEMPSVSEGPETTLADAAYQGPSLTQAALADVMVGRVDPSVALNETRQAAAAPFDDVLNCEASWFAKHGHTPVHTVNSTLASALVDLLSSLGINDELAEFVETTAHRIQREERGAWSSLSSRQLLAAL